MPGEDQAAAAAAASSAGAPAAASGGTLTLADLQGVIAGLQQQTHGPPPGLSDIVTSEAIADLLANEEARNRLMQELPEEQRSMEHLEENLRSPQVQQTLRSLMAASLPDDNGSIEGCDSVLANFQLEAQAGQAALTETNNPIQAFLDCVLSSTQKEKEEEAKDEEMKEQACKKTNSHEVECKGNSSTLSSVIESDYMLSAARFVFKETSLLLSGG
jgi:predicted RNA binding protein with dsRBD fold (UPF0201 family)